MRLLSCHVDNFGVLQNYDYDFEDGLNIVLQDNGWGKTTLATFLKVMLYGFTSKNSKDITENERKRYLPWQGGTFGGYLDFEANGKRYRVHRSFGAQPRLDKTRIVDLDTNTTAKMDSDYLGESLFHLDASAFQRSVFINQNGLSMDGAASSIHTRLNNLVSQANDLAIYDEAIKKLTEQTKVYEKTGQRGRLGDIARALAEKEKTRNAIEESILQQDMARDRILEIDSIINAVDKELKEKKELLEKISGDAKKAEASQKLLDDINGQISDVQARLDALREKLGDAIPSIEEIERAKEENKNVVTLTEQIRALDNSVVKLETEYYALMHRYADKLPTDADLDDIQSIYGELQGIISTAEDNEETVEAPAGYTEIISAVETDKDFITKLQAVIDSEDSLQKLLRQLTEEDSDAKHAEETWIEKKAQYKDICDEIEGLKAEVEGKENYTKEAVKAAIEALEEIQKKQQLVDLRSTEIKDGQLNGSEEALLHRFGENLPDLKEGEEVLGKVRTVLRKTSELDGLKARLDGENSKADSIEASLAQYAGITNEDTQPVGNPGAPKGKALIGAGLGITAIGIIAGIFMLPLLVVAAVGIALLAIGAQNNRKYKEKVRKYEEFRAKADRNAENLHKKQNLEGQLHEVQNAIDSLNAQISDAQNVIDSDNAVITAWANKWMPNQDVSEDAISDVLDASRQIGSVKEKKRELDDKIKQIEEARADIEAKRKDVENYYPELIEKDAAEALEMLREETNLHQSKMIQLDKAFAKKEKFLDDLGIKEADMYGESSPNKMDDSGKPTTKEKMEQLISDGNDILASVNLEMNSEDFAEVLSKAEKYLIEYMQFCEKQDERGNRQNKRKQQTDNLQKMIEEKSVILQGQYPELSMPERLARIREDIVSAKQMWEKLNTLKDDKEKSVSRLENAKDVVDAFVTRFVSDPEDSAAEIDMIADCSVEYRDLEKQKGQLLKQRESIEEDLKKAAGGDTEISEEEQLLKFGIQELEEKRDSFRDEYQQKNDFIRQTDEALEKYPDVVNEIRQLFDEKQKALNALDTLRRTIALITKAKGNLANRYLSNVENLFNDYMQIWLNNDAIRGILDIDFKVQIEESGVEHQAQGYSTGYCDLIDFCMRLALVDTLFENEQPFLILDDPFVNLDTDRLDKALELLNAMSANKQIVYFVCHPIRAVEKNGNSETRQKFVELSEATRKSISEKKAATVIKKPAVKKLPRELYKIKNSAFKPAIKPAKPEYVITNSIFSMKFIADEMFDGDASYELFFIDAIGHVLNERQTIEVKSGKLSVDRIQFSLNTRDDSGDTYELMIRDSGADDDYEVLQRIPFTVKLAFTGSFSFDF